MLYILEVCTDDAPKRFDFKGLFKLPPTEFLLLNLHLPQFLLPFFTLRTSQSNTRTVFRCITRPQLLSCCWVPVTPTVYFCLCQFDMRTIRYIGVKPAVYGWTRTILQYKKKGTILLLNLEETFWAGLDYRVGLVSGKGRADKVLGIRKKDSGVCLVVEIDE